MENAIFITGTAKRLGLYLAARLLKEGYPVIAHYRTKSDELKNLEGKMFQTVYGDFENLETITEMIATIKNITPSLRGIIHNASYFEPTSANLNEVVVQYRNFFNVHMLAPYLINEQLVPLLTKCDSRYADIIHITDIFTERPDPKFDIYSSTKAGLSNLTRSFAKKYAPKIKVNEIAPGPILFKNHSQVVIDKILTKTLLKTEGGLEPLYIAVKSVLENDYMTGSRITVDGGRTLAE